MDIKKLVEVREAQLFIQILERIPLHARLKYLYLHLYALGISEAAPF